MVAPHRRGSNCCRLRQGTWLMIGLWGRPSRSMAFPIIYLLSLICLLPCTCFPHSSTVPPGFVPFRPIALCRGSGSRSSPSPHGGGILPPHRGHDPPRRGRGRCPDGCTSHRPLSGPPASRYRAESLPRTQRGSCSSMGGALRSSSRFSSFVAVSPRFHP
jgi:hypothetical protein